MYIGGGPFCTCTSSEPDYICASVDLIAYLLNGGIDCTCTNGGPDCTCTNVNQIAHVLVVDLIIHMLVVGLIMHVLVVNSGPFDSPRSGYGYCLAGQLCMF